MATTVAADRLVTLPQQGDSVTEAPARNLALDTYRGFVMLLMMAEVLHLSRVARAYPDSAFWRVLAFHQTHAEWVGCSLHDLIQPSFSFLVGAALPYSLASRLGQGVGFRKLFWRALRRAFILVALGIFLRSLHSPMTNFTFEDTLTQIGLGYPFLFLLGLARSERILWGTFAAILSAYWLAWALYPAPGPGFPWASVGVPAEWPHHLSGFAAHWDKNSNAGAAFDQWFLNLFPRPQRFVFNSGGYLTTSFVPTLGTMTLGLIAGRWMREFRQQQENGNLALPELWRRLVGAGVAGVLLGSALHWAGICPIVKRIWTPSWTLFSGGLCFLLMAGFLWAIEARQWRRWTFPLVVIGANSIAAYCIAHLWERFFEDSLRIHLGANAFAFLGAGPQPLLQGLAVLTCYWLVLAWMYRRKIFLRI